MSDNFHRIRRLVLNAPPDIINEANESGLMDAIGTMLLNHVKWWYEEAYWYSRNSKLPNSEINIDLQAYSYAANENLQIANALGLDYDRFILPIEMVLHQLDAVSPP